MGRLLTTYSYTAQYLKNCGIWCSQFGVGLASFLIKFFITNQKKKKKKFGIHWVMPRSVVELLACWSNKFNKLRSKVLWRMIPHCLMWVIWRERNTCIFDGNERSIHALKLFFFQTLFDWANATGVFTFISLLDMLDFCTFIVTFFFPRCF